MEIIKKTDNFKKKANALIKFINSNKTFEFFVIAIIILSALSVGIKSYDLPNSYTLVLGFLDNIITVIFVIEITIRLLAEKKTLDFFKNGWNVFDFIIVLIAIIPIQETDAATLGRLIRIFRLMRMVSLIPELKILMGALFKSLAPLGYVVLLMFVIFYIYAAVGTIYFEKINPDLWGDISISLLTLFRVMTFEDWTDVMYEVMEVYHYSWIYFLSFIFLSAFTFLNMMVAIVVEVMDSERRKVEIENDIGEGAEIHHIYEEMIKMQKKMDKILDKQSNNTP